MSVYKISILLVFSRECMERSLMTSFRILSSFECFYVIFKQNDQFFYPLVRILHKLQCFKSCQSCARTDRGRGVINQAWTGLDRGRGRGSQKFPNLCGHPLQITPQINSNMMDCSVIAICPVLVLK